MLYLFDEVRNFQGYQIFGFRPYIDNKNLENSGSFLKFLNWSEILFLFEETGKFRVFDFDYYGEREKSRKTFQNIFKACKLNFFSLKKL